MEAVMTGYASVRLNVLHMLPDFLESRGVSSTNIFRSVGIADVSEVYGAAVVQRSQVCSALQVSSRNLGLPHLGLLLGESAEPMKLGASGRALIVGRTLFDCLCEHARLIHRIHGNAELSLHVTGSVAVWSHIMRDPRGEGVDVLYEGATAFVCRSIRSVIGREWRPMHLSFPHPCRGKPAVYEDFFEAPVFFGVGRGAEIAFDAAALSRMVFCRPAATLPVFDFDDDDLSCARPPDEAVLSAVETMVESHLGNGGITLPDVARTLGMPLRSIQRRLKSHGMTFEGVLDRHRRNRAESMVLAGQSSVTEIAMNLGYSDSAHFVRAFKRWTGRTPTSYSAGPERVRVRI